MENSLFGTLCPIFLLIPNPFLLPFSLSLSYKIYYIWPLLQYFWLTSVRKSYVHIYNTYK